MEERNPPAWVILAVALVLIAAVIFIARSGRFQIKFSWPFFLGGLVALVIVNLISGAVYQSDARPLALWVGHGIAFGILLGIVGGISPSRMWRYFVIPVGTVVGLALFVSDWYAAVAPKLPSAGNILGSLMAIQIGASIAIVAIIAGLVATVRQPPAAGQPPAVKTGKQRRTKKSRVS